MVVFEQASFSQAINRCAEMEQMFYFCTLMERFSLLYR